MPHLALCNHHSRSTTDPLHLLPLDRPARRCNPRAGAAICPLLPPLRRCKEGDRRQTMADTAVHPYRTKRRHTSRWRLGSRGSRAAGLGICRRQVPWATIRRCGESTPGVFDSTYSTLTLCRGGASPVAHTSAAGSNLSPVWYVSFHAKRAREPIDSVTGRPMPRAVPRLDQTSIFKT